MAKLSKYDRKECKKLSKTMLDAADFFGFFKDGDFCEMTYNLGGYFRELPGLTMTVAFYDCVKVRVSFGMNGKQVEHSRFFTFNQLCKVRGSNGDHFVFDYDSCEKQLYGVFKYLYKNYNRN